MCNVYTQELQLEFHFFSINILIILICSDISLLSKKWKVTSVEMYKRRHKFILHASLMMKFCILNWIYELIATWNTLVKNGLFRCILKEMSHHFSTTNCDHFENVKIKSVYICINLVKAIFGGRDHKIHHDFDYHSFFQCVWFCQCISFKEIPTKL